MSIMAIEGVDAAEAERILEEIRLEKAKDAEAVSPS